VVKLREGNKRAINGNMGGKFSKASLRKELILIYREFIKENYNGNVSSDKYKSSLRKKARDLYKKAIMIGIVFGEPFKTAIDGLEHIGWSFPNFTRNIQYWSLTKKKAKKILDDLYDSCTKDKGYSAVF